MCDNDYLMHMHKLNVAGLKVRELWRNDPKLCPIDRYDSERNMFNLAMDKYVDVECCRTVVQLKKVQLVVWRGAMERAQKRVCSLAKTFLLDGHYRLEPGSLDAPHLLEIAEGGMRSVYTTSVEAVMAGRSRMYMHPPNGNVVRFNFVQVMMRSKGSVAQ
eukprot:gene24098-9673_t